MPYLELKNFDHLRVGLFIKIQGSWFSHPFSVSMFKITSKKEIETLRGLKRIKLLYDPSRSDPAPKIDEVTEEPPETEDYPNSDVALETEPLLEEVEEEFEEAEVVEKYIDPREYQKERSQLFQKHIKNLKKIESAYSTVLRDSEKIFSGLISRRPESVGIAKQVVSDLVEVFQHQGVSMTLMDVLDRNGLGWGLSTHSLNVCILSLLMGKELQLEKEQLNSLGQGALFHDIGERLVPMKVQFSEVGMKMQADSELRKLHPEKGQEWMQRFGKIPINAIDIIIQHHERLNGSGYPKGLSGDEIGFLTQIVMVADDYDEMCNAAVPENRRTPHEALSLIYRSFLGEGTPKYSENVVQALIRAITVYPPGTFIQLSDETYGVVTSINSENPLRPFVMLYSPEEVNHEAMILDLLKEEHLQVQKVVRPNELPPKIHERLSRRHVAVFLHAAEEITQAQFA